MHPAVRLIRGAVIATLALIHLLPQVAQAQGGDSCLVGSWTSTNLVDYMNSVGGVGRAPIMPDSADVPPHLQGAVPISPTFIVSEISGGMVLQFLPTETRAFGPVGSFNQVTGPGGLAVTVIARDNTVMRTDYNVRVVSDYTVESANVLTFTNPMMQFGEAAISFNGTDLGVIPLDGMAEEASTLFGPTSAQYECTGDTLRLSPMLRGMTLTPQVYQRNP